MTQKMPRHSIIVSWLAASLLFGLLTFMAYRPGLHGDFLFDDFANLPNLGSTGPIDNWPTFWRYITSGNADPTGRPISLLTFLLDAHNWPADAYPFKRTNLIIHLLNGVLLARLLQKLGQQLFPNTDTRRINVAAMFGASCWLLHPLFVSTTLYVVQREAMLAATFTLLGLLLWLHGRKTLERGYSVAGALWIALGLGGCTTLAMLSKANGILLPAMALVIEHIVFRFSLNKDPAHQSSPGSREYRLLMLLFAWLPATLVIMYLANQAWQGFVHGVPDVRPWTLGQRLLTEPRVLVDYLRLLWLPQPYTSSIFNDDLRASTSLLAPYTTLPALLFTSALIVGAWLSRHRLPAVSATILFYFVGQSIESSTIPLELYFEHRNYLPAMLMFWPLALWLCNVHQFIPTPSNTTHYSTPSIGHVLGEHAPKNDKLKFSFALIILLVLGTTTHSCAELWGNARDQAILWAKLNPSSPRAQANAALVEMRLGYPARAAQRLRQALAHAPDEPQLALNLFSAECMQGHVDPVTLNAVQVSLRATRDMGPLLLNWFDTEITQSRQPLCAELSLQTLSKLLDAAMENPQLMASYGRRQDVYHLKGELALAQGHPGLALLSFNQALDQQVSAQAALQQAAMLGAAGFPLQGLAHLDHYKSEQDHVLEENPGMPRLHAWLLKRQQYWPNELANLHTTLAKDAAKQSVGNQ